MKKAQGKGQFLIVYKNEKENKNIKHSDLAKLFIYIIILKIFNIENVENVLQMKDSLPIQVRYFEKTHMSLRKECSKT